MAESRSSTAAAKKKAPVRRKKTEAVAKPATREQAVPIMLRPKLSQKECVEHIADQLGVKRSQLDPSFYLTGALISGVERLGKAEMIGDWSRKEVATYLKSTFLPLFELLYEQDELPLVFSLLIARGAPMPLPQPNGNGTKHAAIEDALPQAVQKRVNDEDEAYVPMLGADAEVGLDGFPGGI